MPEVDMKIELIDWEISSHDSVAEDTVSYSNRDQIELKTEKIIETRLKEEMGQPPPDHLTCSSCSATFETLPNLVEHSLIHHDKNMFHCDVCSKLLHDSKTQFKIHVATHIKYSAEGDRSLLYESEDGTAELEDESVSMEAVTDIKNAYVTDPLDESVTHMIENGSSEQNEAAYIGDADASKQVMKGKKYYTCNFCNQKHGSKSSLECHMGLHSKGTQKNLCHICGAKLKSNTELLRHISSVHDKRSFVCLYCQKVFLDKVSKGEHERLHRGNNSFVCIHCNKVFQTKSLLHQHEKKHRKSCDSFGYKCSYCLEKFQFESLLVSHILKCTAVQQYKCSVCSKGYSRKLDLERHELRFHHEFTAFSEKEKSRSVGHAALEASVSSVNSDVEHVSSVADSDSPDCGENGRNNSSHNINKKLNTRLYDSFCYQCTQCPKKFSLSTVLAAHMLKHKRETFKCISCMQDFQNSIELQKHTFESHTSTNVGDAQQLKNAVVVLEDISHVLNPRYFDSAITQTINPSKVSDPVSPEKVTLIEQNSVSDDKECDGSNISKELNLEGCIPSTSTCDDKRDAKCGLKVGYKKIKSFRPVFICHVCGKHFYVKYGLIRHLQCVHEGRRDFKCSFCQKGFSEKVGRDDHERIHTGEKPYKCDLCDKSFRAKAMLCSHKRHHSKLLESRRFQCAHCPKRFHFQSALTAHMRKHTGERQYICTLCSKGFYRRIDLAKHTARRHSDRKTGNIEPLHSEAVSVDKIGTEQKAALNTAVSYSPAMKVDENCRTHSVHIEATGTSLTPYKCEECGKIFYEKMTLEVHTRIHTGERPHTCQMCGLQFRQISGLHRHLRTVHEGRRDFACHFCGKEFGEKVTRDDHLRIHTGERPYPCDLCEKWFKSRVAVTVHKKCHSNFLPHECVICGKCFRFPGLLIKHMKSHTGEVKDRPHQCKECGKCFLTRSVLRAHERVHTKEKPFTCEQCGKQFRISGGLKRHVRNVHEGRRDFPCGICGRDFAEKAALDNHIRTHTGERPYRCDVCGKRFKTRSSVCIHKKFHTNTYAASCPTCQKHFRTQSSLSIHLRTHTGERPHPCDICDKRFITNKDMLKHRVIHSDDKPFECALCGMGFRLKCYLTKHMFKNHDIEEIK